MIRARWDGGWWLGARRIDSPNHGPRPAGIEPTLLVLHSISLPPGEYGGDAIERLFTNRLDPAEHPSFAPLQGLHVSSHFVIRRTGLSSSTCPVNDARGMPADRCGAASRTATIARSASNSRGSKAAPSQRPSMRCWSD